MAGTIYRRSYRVAALLVMCCGLLVVNNVSCGTNSGGFTADDQAAACNQKSPGGEIAYGAALRARVVKAQFNYSQCTLTRSGGNETLVLVAQDPNNGFAQNETNAELRASFTHVGGAIVTGNYLDSPATSQQTMSFQASATSSPSTNALPLFNGTGSGTVTDFMLTGNNVKFHATFNIKVFEVFTATVQDLCGEINFDGPVTISG